MTILDVREELAVKYEKLKKYKLKEDSYEENEEETALIAGGKLKGRCHNCGKFGHKASECRNKVNSEKKKGKFQGKCFHCGKVGHKKENCWLLHGKPKDQANSVITESNDDEIVLLCSYIGEDEWTRVKSSSKEIKKREYFKRENNRKDEKEKEKEEKEIALLGASCNNFFGCLSEDEKVNEENEESSEREKENENENEDLHIEENVIDEVEIMVVDEEGEEQKELWRQSDVDRVFNMENISESKEDSGSDKK